MANKRLQIEILGDSRSLERAFGRAGKSGSQFQQRMGRIAKASALALGAAGVASIGLGAKMVKLAGDAEEVESKFKVVFGREMPKMIKTLDKFSEATGASRFVLRQQTADLGALIAPILGNTRAAAEMSVGFTKLATDLSSFNNVPVEDALIAIRAGLVGEAEPLRRFGVLINEAAVKAEAYRSKIAKVGAVLTEQQKVQARANLIMQQTTLAQGDATRTADSFTNQLRRLKNSAIDTGTALGQKLLPAATTVLAKLNEWGPALQLRLQPHLNRLGAWAREHEDEFRQLFKDASETAGTLGRALVRAAEGADRLSGALGGWAKSFELLIGGVLAAKLAGVLGILGGPGGTGKGGILGMMTKLKGLGPVTLVVALSMHKKVGDVAKIPAVAKHLAELDAARQIPTARPEEGTRGVGTVQLPTSQSSTHETTGLGGFPAVDIFARAGSAVKAPEDGHITRVRPFSNDPAFFGAAIYFVGAKTGNTYYIKHIFNPAAIGGYKKGAVIAYVAHGTAGGDHVHFGIKKGAGAVAAPGAISGGSGGGAASPGKTTAKELPLIPARLRESLARAEGTKNLGDDLTALGAVAKYLERILPKTKDVEKRIEITEALNSVRSKIKEILEGKKEAQKKIDISQAVAWDKLQERMKDRFKAAMDAAQQKVVASRGAFGTAFGMIADKLYRVFDAKTEALLANARARVGAFGFEIGVGEETPAERMLRARQDARTDAELQAALASATTAEERAAAVAAIEDRALEEQARAERQAADQALATEQRRIQEERDAKRGAFATELADLETKWARTKATTDTRTAELKALMAKYEIPFGEVGSLIGQSFATAFMTSLQVVFDALNDLERRIAQAKKTKAEGMYGPPDPWLVAIRGAAGPAVTMPSPQRMTMAPIVTTIVLDGKVVAETVRNQNALYQRRGGSLQPI